MSKHRSKKNVRLKWNLGPGLTIIVALFVIYVSLIYKDDINNFIDRINGLDQVKHQICNVRDIKVNNNQIYDFATKYFEFVESNE